MENAQIFPLLCLPHLAIREVLTEMTLFDLVNFSLTSSKTKIITRSITRTWKNKYRLEVSLDKILKLFIDQRPKGIYLYEMTCDKSKSEAYCYNRGYHIIQKYSEDVLEEFKRWTGYVLNVLSAQINQILFLTDSFPNQNKSTIDWLKSATKSIESVKIKDEKSIEKMQFEDETVTHFFQNLKITKNLNLCVKLSKNFDSSLIPNVSNYIFIEFCSWLTVQHFTSFNCSIFEINDFEECKIQDFHRFFMSWMSSESNLNLTNFSACVFCQRDLDELVKNIPHEQIGQEVERALLPRGDKIKGGIDILRKTDGKRATLFILNRLLCFPRLYMAVH